MMTLKEEICGCGRPMERFIWRWSVSHWSWEKVISVEDIWVEWPDPSTPKPLLDILWWCSHQQDCSVIVAGHRWWVFLLDSPGATCLFHSWSVFFSGPYTDLSSGCSWWVQCGGNYNNHTICREKCMASIDTWEEWLSNRSKILFSSIALDKILEEDNKVLLLHPAAAIGCTCWPLRATTDKTWQVFLLGKDKMGKDNVAKSIACQCHGDKGPTTWVQI